MTPKQKVVVWGIVANVTILVATILALKPVRFEALIVWSTDQVALACLMVTVIALSRIYHWATLEVVPQAKTKKDRRRA